jgi:hypothetical protein
MKKLILVTLLAVGASWLLSEARQGSPAPQITEHGPRSLRMLPGPMVVVDGPDVVALHPPAPPTPPTPPDSIKTVPWRKGNGPRAKRAATPPAPSKAKSAPSWFPKSEVEEDAKARPDAFGSRVLVGRVSVSEDRARQDLRKTLEREVADWLAADVPTSWKVPARVLNSMAQGMYIQEVTKSLGPVSPEVAAPSALPSTPEVAPLDSLYSLYRAGQKLDFSPSRRAQIVGMYRRDLASWRMQRLGGGLALALVGLAVLSGYIKADEATKGYYTNRLRLVAAAGLGAAGVVAYRFLT